MTSASRTVVRRWAITSMVTSPWRSSIARWMRCSFSESRALVASSRINNDGRRNRALARARRCRSPPDNRTPRSPRTVSSPSGSLRTNSSAAASSRAWTISSFVRLGMGPEQVGPHCIVEQERILGHVPDLAAPGAYSLRTQWYVVYHHPSVARRDQPQEQVGDGALTCAGWAYDGRGLPGADGQVQVADGWAIVRCLVVGEAYVPRTLRPDLASPPAGSGVSGSADASKRTVMSITSTNAGKAFKKT